MTGGVLPGALRSPFAHELRLIFKGRGYRLLAAAWVLVVVVSFIQSDQQPLGWLQALTSAVLPLLAPVTLVLSTAVLQREEQLAGGDWWHALPYWLPSYLGLRLAALTLLGVVAFPLLPLLMALAAGAGAPMPAFVLVLFGFEWMVTLLAATAVGAVAAALFTTTLASGGFGLLAWGIWVGVLGWLPLQQGWAEWALITPHLYAFPGWEVSHVWGFGPHEELELLRHLSILAAALLLLALALRRWRPGRFPRQETRTWVAAVVILGLILVGGAMGQAARHASLAPTIWHGDPRQGGEGVVAELQVPDRFFAGQEVTGTLAVTGVAVGAQTAGELEVAAALRVARLPHQPLNGEAVAALAGLAPEARVTEVAADCGRVETTHSQGLLLLQVAWSDTSLEVCHLELTAELKRKRLVRRAPSARPQPALWWDESRLLLASGTFWYPVPLAVVADRLAPYAWAWQETAAAGAADHGDHGLAGATTVAAPNLAVAQDGAVHVYYPASIGTAAEAGVAAAVLARADAFLARMVPAPRSEPFRLYVLPAAVPVLVEGAAVLAEHHWLTFAGLKDDAIPPLGGLAVLDVLLAERWYPPPAAADAEDLAVRRAGVRTLELIYLREAGQTSQLTARRDALRALADHGGDPLEVQSARVALALLDRYRRQGTAGVFEILAPLAAVGQERLLRFADLPDVNDAVTTENGGTATP